MKNSIFNNITILVFLITSLAFQACKKDSPPNPNEQELITTVKLSFVDQNGTESVYQWHDIDGAGGNNPIIDTIRLTEGAIYVMTVSFLDESKNPVQDITSEIKDESESHLILASADNNLNLQFIIQDKDDKNLPLGLTQIVQLGTKGSGNINLLLLHQSDKTSSDPATTGETDIEVKFPAIVQ